MSSGSLSPRLHRRSGITLSESVRRPILIPTVSALLSFGAHVGVVAGVVLASSVAVSYTPEDDARAARFLYPLLRQAPRPLAQQVTYVGLKGVPSAPELAPAKDPDLAKTPLAVEEPEPAQLEPAEVEPQRPFSELEVDSTALRDPESAGPVYPPSLLAKNIEGVTLVRFVVGEDGRVDLSTFRVISSTDSLFTKSTRETLPKMKFRPAWFNGKPVSQLVEQAFIFRITKPVPNAEGHAVPDSTHSVNFFEAAAI